MCNTLTPQAQLSFQETIGFERMLKYARQSPVTDRRECKMNDLISFVVILIISENFENFSFGRLDTLTITDFEHFF